MHVAAAIAAAKVGYVDIGKWDVDVYTRWPRHTRPASAAVIDVRDSRVKGRGTDE